MLAIDWFVPERLREDIRTRRRGRILVGSPFALASSRRTFATPPATARLRKRAFRIRS